MPFQRKKKKKKKEEEKDVEEEEEEKPLMARQLATTCYFMFFSKGPWSFKVTVLASMSTNFQILVPIWKLYWSVHLFLACLLVSSICHINARSCKILCVYICIFIFSKNNYLEDDTFIYYYFSIFLKTKQV